MRKGIATVCMSGMLADKLAAAAEAGYAGVEIFENDLTYFDGSPEDVRALAGSLGLEILALQPFRDFEGLPEPQRTRAFERARRKLELMGRLGTKLLLVCSSVSPDAIDDLERVAADLHELGELAAPHGITIGFEALCWGRHINDYRQAWEAVRKAEYPKGHHEQIPQPWRKLWTKETRDGFTIAQEARNLVTASQLNLFERWRQLSLPGLARLPEEGAFRPLIGARFALAQALQAMHALRDRRVPGKVVIEMPPP